MAYFPPNPNGQTVKADSSPSVLATEQEAILQSISDNIEYLKDNPTTGGSTETTLSAIKTVLDDLLLELNMKGDLGETQPVSATALPLPSGASTASNQTDIKTLLSDLKDQNDLLLAELELKASLSETQPVSVSGVSTEVTLALIKAKTDNLDVLLSSRTKPTDTQPVSVSSLPLPTGSATETTLASIKTNTDKLDVLLSTLKGLTDTELRASALPVSVSGVASEATLALIKAKTDNLDVLLGSIKGLTDSELRANPLNVTISNSIPLGLTDTELRASPLDLPVGASTSAEQATTNSLITTTNLEVAKLHDIVFEVKSTGFYRTKAAHTFTISGRRTAFTSNTLMNDLGEGLGTAGLAEFLSLTGAETIQLISSNANDTLAGTGARTVRITYINTSGNITSASVNMNGTTAVVTGISTLGILWIETEVLGTALGAVGTITLRTSTPTTLSVILPTYNKSTDAFFMVPTGFTGYIYSWEGACFSSEQDLRIRATVNTLDSSYSGNIFRHHDNMFIPANTGFRGVETMLKLPALSKVKLSTVTANAGGGTKVDAGFNILLIAN